MTSLGNGHDNVVNKWANSYIPDLRSQEESMVPSYIEQSSGFTVADQGSEAESTEEEDDECSDSFSVSVPLIARPP